MHRGPSHARIVFLTTILSIVAALAAIGSIGLAATTVPEPSAAVKSPEQPAHADTLAGMVSHFLAGPNKENFTALQSRVVADRGYDQSSRALDEVIDLYKQKRYQAALERFTAAMPDQLLSAQGHFYAARCYDELGQKEQGNAERAFTRACLQGLMATGDGSPERPIVVTHVADEYDLLAAPLHTDSKSQSLQQKNGRWYDVLECADGKSYWFDVTLTFGRGARGQQPIQAPAMKPAAATSVVQARSQSTMVPVERPAPIQPIPSNAELAQAAYARGTAANSRHDYNQAVTELNEAIRRDMMNPDAYFERGFAYLENMNYGAAYADFSDAIRLRSDYALAFYERGLALRLAGNKARYDDAIADFSEALRLAPGDYLVWRNRAMVWFAKGDYRKAISDNSEAIALEPNDAMSYSNRGFAYESAGDYTKAVADFNQALRLSPRFAQAYTGRGVAWVGRGEFDLAIADLDEAIRLKPDYAAALAYRSTAFAQKGDEKRAQADAAKAASLRGGP